MLRRRKLGIVGLRVEGWLRQCPEGCGEGRGLWSNWGLLGDNSRKGKCIHKCSFGERVSNVFSRSQHDVFSTVEVSEDVLDCNYCIYKIEKLSGVYGAAPCLAGLWSQRYIYVQLVRVISDSPVSSSHRRRSWERRTPRRDCDILHSGSPNSFLVPNDIRPFRS